MSTKYQVSKFEPTIIAVNVVKETEKTYTVRTVNWRGPSYTGTDVRVMFSSTPLYATWEDAQAALIARLQKDVDYHKRALARYESGIETVKACAPPVRQVSEE